MNLTKQQRIAIDSTENAILLKAGAGTGKTATLKSRIARIVGEGVTIPSMILAVTFSRKAADEIKERLENDGVFGVAVTTFHSWCWMYLIENDDTHFTVLDETSQKSLIKKLTPEDCEIKVRDVINWISLQKTLMLRAANVHNNLSEKDDLKFCEIYELYEKHCIDHNLMDFGEMELRCYESLKKHGHQGQYRHLLIDEYQDTSPVEIEIIKLIKTDNIFAVGDPKQRIYEFRGAYARNINDFIKYFNATELYLTTNFRSTHQIVKNADDTYGETVNRMKAIKEGKEVYRKSFSNETEEAEWTARQVKRISEKTNSSIAILFRKKVNMRAFEAALLKQGLKFNIVGAMPFLNYKEIQDVLAWLQYCWNLKNKIALERLLKQQKGCGQVAIERILTFNLDARSEKKWDQFCELCSKVFAILDEHEHDLSGAITKIVEVTDLLSNYKDNINARANRLQKLSEIAAGKNIEEFLYEIANEPSEEVEKSVQIMTIHKVKGLEFGYVFIPCNEYGILPADDSESEKNVVHVALTRAEEMLILTSCSDRVEYGKHKFRTPTI